MVVLRLLQTVNESYVCTTPCDCNDLSGKGYTYLMFNSYMYETLGKNGAIRFWSWLILWISAWERIVKDTYIRKEHEVQWCRGVIDGLENPAREVTGVHLTAIFVEEGWNHWYAKRVLPIESNFVWHNDISPVMLAFSFMFTGLLISDPTMSSAQSIWS